MKIPSWAVGFKKKKKKTEGVGTGTVRVPEKKKHVSREKFSAVSYDGFSKIRFIVEKI